MNSKFVKALCAVSLLSGFALTANSEPLDFQPLIRVNQIGYLPNSNKVAVIADPQVGQNADESFTPGSVYQIRQWDDDSVALEGIPSIWNNGATHAQSGDRGWWFDFSSLTENGSYYVWDVENEVASYRFEIGPNIYNQILKVAMRTFYYQRLAIEKPAEFAGEDWVDSPAFIHAGQDTEARSVHDQQNPNTERDLSGGWMDAGDYNKYVTFAEIPVHQLLNAFEERPEVFGDNYNIPESGNGIPDILDEVHFEMLWLAKMQEDDGGVIMKLGDIDFNSPSPPSTDFGARFYVPPCSSSSIAAAGMYAHAAIVFRNYPEWEDFANELEQRAIDAWTWYHANPKSDSCDEQIVKSGDADRDLNRQAESAVVSAMYLHRLTELDEYKEYVEDNYLSVNPFSSAFFSVYNSYAAEAFLHYATSSMAPANIAAEIKQRKLSNENNGAIVSWNDNTDLYRAQMPDAQYHWGSLSVTANFGNANLDYQAFGYTEANFEERQKRGEAMLDYYFGVNPMGLTYLTQMQDFGAENSIREIYHSWFAYNSDWDTNPPPGYVPGGANRSYGGTIDELKGLPPQKSYLDFNESFPENSWEVTENAIYYQSAFVRLLSKFASQATPTIDDGDDDQDGIANSFEDWFGFDKESFSLWEDRVRIQRTDTHYQLEILRSNTAETNLVQARVSSDLISWYPIDLSNPGLSFEMDSLVGEIFNIGSASSPTLFIRFSLGDYDSDVIISD